MKAYNGLGEVPFLSQSVFIRVHLWLIILVAAHSRYVSAVSVRYLAHRRRATILSIHGCMSVTSDWREFPPRLPEQPIFYPVLNEEYATQIARDWNVRESGAGFVTRFCVEADFVGRYPVQVVGNATHRELWVPA